MTRKTFDGTMGQLKDEVLLLGSMVEQATQQAVHSLVKRDVASARLVIANDQRVNDRRYAIENAVLIQIATQQPAARDLRVLTAILEIINELERMGDYAKGIGKVVIALGDSELTFPSAEFLQMGKLASGMLHNALSAFVTENAGLAQRIPPEDEKVDTLYLSIYRELTAAMIANPKTIDQTNTLMWAAHNLERLADRVVNICERTIFICTGELFELDGGEVERNANIPV